MNPSMGATRELLWTLMFLHELQQQAPQMTGIHISAGTTITHLQDVQSCKNIANILTKPLMMLTLMHIQELFSLTVSKEPTGSRGGAEIGDPMMMLKSDTTSTRSEIRQSQSNEVADLTGDQG
ncbi:hypothetical protein NDA11_000931 [Ustilago hordei]|uniref:Rho-GAP domain-containing protein n=1 Tax=Ustilago hordei TaxID=120017 RepID=I2FZ40_USTHO|nr:hypothetical protein NDA10_002165 [Ustilago hordei]KAJ1583953.1 hypothetical protein NDA11_000931 [Ustilago hordei]KAJ1599247.1 hypothetical protein NDA14_005148 [Ustilago hordei]UTT91189.1 hypothetical protein NDA17_003975 [Ustilago hordei]CCF52183.1 uncharacterized protein UHOR_08470 [Ustilago hordei]